MIRILHVYPQLNNAGTETVIINLYRNIDRSLIQFDFLIQKPGELDAAFQASGAQIHLIEKTNRYAADLLAFFHTHPEYRIIHTHTHAEMGMVLKQAHRAGVPHRIAHSHNSRGDVPKIMRYYKILSGWNIERHATHFLACSQEAAMWLFPRKYHTAQVWHNAIDLQRFQFNPEVRQSYRASLGIPADAKVVCHVGRFAEQKNHKRIVALLNQLMQQDHDAYGILVGTGPLLDRIKAAANSSRILFLGNRTDVPDILCAADVFLFPSLYEGLGIVAVEAQASGLLCIASSTVPQAADIGIGLYAQLPLSLADTEWLRCITDALSLVDMETRKHRSEESLKTRYNISIVASMAQQYYAKME